MYSTFPLLSGTRTVPGIFQAKTPGEPFLGFSNSHLQFWSPPILEFPSRVSFRFSTYSASSLFSVVSQDLSYPTVHPPPPTTVCSHAREVCAVGLHYHPALFLTIWRISWCPPGFDPSPIWPLFKSFPALVQPEPRINQHLQIASMIGHSLSCP